MMATNRAAFVDTLNGGRNKEASEAGKMANLRLAAADERGNGRVRRLVDLASSLMREAQVLARDKTFVDESSNLKSLDLTKGIDFYSEVQRFETGLIRLALDQTHGHQAQAARLLRIKPTTLNSKIKLYGIEY